MHASNQQVTRKDHSGVYTGTRLALVERLGTCTMAVEKRWRYKVYVYTTADYKQLHKNVFCSGKGSLLHITILWLTSDNKYLIRISSMKENLLSHYQVLNA